MNTSVKRQLVASVTGRALAGGLQFAFTPIYLAALGAESYGLIGFYLALFGLVLFLDQAVSPVVTRRFAQVASEEPERSNLGDVFRTMEVLSLVTALVVITSITIACEEISRNLLHANAGTSTDVTAAVRLIAVMIAVQWPSFMYAGVLSGVGNQVALNTTRGCVALIQWTGGVLVLYASSGDVLALFVWQIVCFTVQTLIFRLLALKSFSVQTAPRFRLEVLTRSWRFSAGTLIIGLTGSVLTQADKLFVSRFESLRTFAAYSLAFTVASLVQVFVAQPVMAIAFPHFAKCFARGDNSALSREYRQWTQAIVFVVMPLTLILVFFPEQILLLWLHGQSQTIQVATVFLPWVAAGTMLNVIMTLPFNLQLASGWTSLSSIKNLIILPPFLLALTLGIPSQGAIVGAICWFLVNFAYFVVEVPVMHRRLLREDLWFWWLGDVIAPGVLATAICLLAKFIVFRDTPFAALAVAWISSTVVLAFALSFPRKMLSSAYRRARNVAIDTPPK